MKDYDQVNRIEKIQNMSYGNAEKLIFEWVKTGVINLKQFSELNQVNKDAI